MPFTRLAAAIVAATSFALLLSSCGEDIATIETMPPSPPATAVGAASGNGTMDLMIWSKDPNVPPQHKKVDFAPKYTYAYAATGGGQRSLWIVVADQSPDTAKLDAADDRNSMLRDWCDQQHARFVALQLDAGNKPMASRTCAGDGRVDSSQLSEDSKSGSRAEASLTLNDGKRIEGGMVTGVGSLTRGDQESIAEISGDYHFSADLAPPTLRDRVLAGGDEKASGVRSAKAAFLKYWNAAGSVKSVEEIYPWFTPERHAHTAQQMTEIAQYGNMAEQALKMFTDGHSKSPDLTAAKAIGAAAVITHEAAFGGAKQTCQTLMLQLQGAWKVGNENCEQRKPDKA